MLFLKVGGVYFYIYLILIEKLYVAILSEQKLGMTELKWI